MMQKASRTECAPTDSRRNHAGRAVPDLRRRWTRSTSTALRGSAKRVDDRVGKGGDVARAAGAEVVGAASIIDRSGGQQGLDVPYFSLATVSFPTYQPETCPLCAAGQPVVKPGSRT